MKTKGLHFPLNLYTPDGVMAYIEDLECLDFDDVIDAYAGGGFYTVEFSVHDDFEFGQAIS